jgi:hypothetical protein
MLCGNCRKVHSCNTQSKKGIIITYGSLTILPLLTLVLSGFQSCTNKFLYNVDQFSDTLTREMPRENRDSTYPAAFLGYITWRKRKANEEQQERPLSCPLL